MNTIINMSKALLLSIALSLSVTPCLPMELSIEFSTNDELRNSLIGSMKPNRDQPYRVNNRSEKLFEYYLSAEDRACGFRIFGYFDRHEGIRDLENNLEDSFVKNIISNEIKGLYKHNPSHSLFNQIKSRSLLDHFSNMLETQSLFLDYLKFPEEKGFGVELITIQNWNWETNKYLQENIKSTFGILDAFAYINKRNLYIYSKSETIGTLNLIHRYCNQAYTNTPLRALLIGMHYNHLAADNDIILNKKYLENESNYISERVESIIFEQSLENLTHSDLYPNAFVQDPVQLSPNLSDPSDLKRKRQKIESDQEIDLTAKRKKITIEPMEKNNLDGVSILNRVIFPSPKVDTQTHSLDTSEDDMQIHQTEIKKFKRAYDNKDDFPQRRSQTLKDKSRNPIYKKLAILVKSKMYTKDQIANKLGITPETFVTHLCTTKALNLLSGDDTYYLNDHLRKSNKVVLKLKQKAPLNEILQEAQLLNKPRVNRVVSKLYKQGVITPQDTKYLKNNKTVIDKRGGTKTKIVQFLQSVSNGEATGSIIELAHLFNSSDYKAIRPITDVTFREHISDLINKGSLSHEILDFYERCKNPHNTRK